MWRCGVGKSLALFDGRSIGLAALLAGSLTGQLDATAQPLEPAQPKYGWLEVWSGADATRDVWLLYGGVTLAPFSEHIYADGLRLRVQSGFGHYSYLGGAVASPTCSAPSSAACDSDRPRYEVDQNYVDALIGYHKRIGELTAKVFVGVASITHDYRQLDPICCYEVVGTDVGVKGVIELWLNLGAHAWTSLDVSYTTAHDTGSARWRGGWRVLPTLSIGPELRYDTNADDDAARGGAFIRYEWFKGEISAAGGWAGAITDAGAFDEQGPAAYGTVNLLVQF